MSHLVGRAGRTGKARSGGAGRTVFHASLRASTFSTIASSWPFFSPSNTWVSVRLFRWSTCGQGSQRRQAVSGSTCPGHGSALPTGPAPGCRTRHQAATWTWPCWRWGPRLRPWLWQAAGGRRQAARSALCVSGGRQRRRHRRAVGAGGRAQAGRAGCTIVLLAHSRHLQRVGKPRQGARKARPPSNAPLPTCC